MIQNALIFLIETLAGLFTVALLVRFYMQWARAPQRNPVADFVNALTNFAVLPARRFIPGLWGLDLATLLVAWLVQFLELLLVLMGQRPQPHGGHRHGTFDPLLLAIHGDRAHNLVHAACERFQHACRILLIRGFTEDPAVADDRRVRREHRQHGQRAPAQKVRGQLGLPERKTQCVILRRFVGERCLVDIETAFRVFAQEHDLECDADLSQQLAPPGTAGCQIDSAHAGRS